MNSWDVICREESHNTLLMSEFHSDCDGIINVPSGLWTSENMGLTTQLSSSGRSEGDLAGQEVLKKLYSVPGLDLTVALVHNRGAKTAFHE